MGASMKVSKKEFNPPSVKLASNQISIAINDGNRMWIDSAPYHDKAKNLLMAQAIGKWLVGLYLDGVFE